MKLGTLIILTAVILFGVLPIPVRLAAQNARSEIITFDAPGASSVAGSFDGTFPKSINDTGAITGHYVDANTSYHGFLRNPGGEFITLDAPGGGTSVGFRFGTFPNSVSIPSSININNRGTITGNYIDANNVSHGFLRSPGGEFITLDAPGASSTAGSFDGTFPSSINNGGAITGSYIDSKELIHGFLRSPRGEFITLDAPGASSVAAAGYGTFPKRINDAGAITGHYTDAHNVTRGFVRSPSGEFTTFDAPGASSTAAFGYGTFPESINDAGAITGHYTDAHGLIHGFLRSPCGKFTTFDAPGASSVAAFGYGTFPESINDAGAITGHYTDAHGLIHGSLRSPSGEFTSFDAPGASSAAASGYGTFPESINDAGAITGHYTDAHGVIHGFLRIR
jgi:hypothetical protein